MAMAVNEKLTEKAGVIARDLDDFVSTIAVQLSNDDYNKLMCAVKKLFAIKKQGIIEPRIIP